MKSKKAMNIITKIEYTVIVISFIIMVISYFISVVNRNIIKGAVPWTEEIALYCMTYMALLGTEVGLRDGTQVAVTAILEKLKGKLKSVVIIIKQIILEIFSFIMLNAGVSLFTKQIKTGQTSPVLKIPISLIYFSLVLSFGLIFIIQGLHLTGLINEFIKGKELEV